MKHTRNCIQSTILAKRPLIPETHGAIYNSVCYLGDTVDGDGAATARIRDGWMRFRVFLPFLTSRAAPLEKVRVYISCVRTQQS